MKSLVYSFVVMVVASTWGAAEASQGRGGAQIVDVNSTPTLADLVTKSVCDPLKSGGDMVDSIPEFEGRVIKSIKKINWYLGASLLNEARRLKYCLTGPLYLYPARDPETPVKPPEGKNLRQVGYRSNDWVYLDSEKFEDPHMTGLMRAMILTHEVTHSYLPMWVRDRQIKLRTFMRAVAKVESGQITTSEELNSAIIENSLEFPASIKSLNAFRGPIEYLLSPIVDQEAQFLNLTEIDSILDLPGHVMSHLAPLDQEYINEFPPSYVLETALANQLVSASPGVFSDLLVDPRFKRLKPTSVALRNFDGLSNIKRLLFETPAVQHEIYQQAFGGIMNATLNTRADGRAELSLEAVEELQLSYSLSTPLMDLEIPNVLPQSFNSFVSFLVYEINKDRWDIVHSILADGFQLNQTLKLIGVHNAINDYTFQFLVEKNFAHRKVTLLSDVLEGLFNQDVQRSLTIDQYRKLKTEFPGLEGEGMKK